MKKILFLLFILLQFFNLTSFAQLKYTNPILCGFYPDPSICRVGNDYYLINSTFAYFPGLPIFHSTDLVNWEQIGNAIDRNEQLDLANAGVSGGLFAPTIRYNEGVFYIICTCVNKGGNFIIKAKNPKGPWSNPVFLPEVNGIDPSLFFDNNGKVYITYNSIPPNNISQYQGHRTIRIVELDLQSLKVIGNNEIIVNGGVDISKKPVWIEGPHLFKKDGLYYLISAEGGTGTNHSEVVFRSNAVKGPYIPYENNPILTQRQLDSKRVNPVSSTGHADFVETQDGRWYSVFLGCRPYEKDYYNTGRETFLCPMEWKNGWPVIIRKGEAVNYKYNVPFPEKTKKINNPFNGNIAFKDSFNTDKLNFRYVFLRNPSKKLYTLDSKKGGLTLNLKPNTASQKSNPAFIGFRQSNSKGYAATSISFSAKSENEKAGLLIFQNETHYYFVCKSIKNNQPVVELYKSSKEENATNELIESVMLKDNISPLQLKIEANNDQYSIYYSVKEDNYSLLKTVDGKFLSTNVAGGFVGSMYAMYATSNGIPTSNTAQFNWFECYGNDDIFK